jgi:hypothetical protein
MAWTNAPWTSKYVSGLATLVRITLTWPEAHTLYFSDLPVFDDTNFGTGVASVGMSSMVALAEMEIGGANAAHRLALRNIRIYEGNTPVGGVYPNYAESLAEVLTEKAFHGAAVTIWQYAKDADTSDRRCVLDVGRIEDVTEVTPASVTVVVVEYQKLENSTAPYYSIGSLPEYDAQKVPDRSKGLAIPSRLGPQFGIPDQMAAYGLTNELARDLIASGHMRSSLVPMRLAYDGRTDGDQLLTWLYQEKMESDSSGFTQAGLNPISFTYLPDLDTFPEMFLVGASGDGYANSNFRYRTLQSGTHVFTAYVIPQDWSEKSSGIINPGNCLDRRVDTWMYLSGTDHIRFKIPTIANPGNVLTSHANAIQVKIFTLSGTPPGETGSASGQLLVGIKHPLESPDQGDYLGGTPRAINCNVLGWQTITNQAFGQLPNEELWQGTRWASWNFTASGSGDTTGPDDQLYAGDQDFGGVAQEIYIEGTSSSTVAYILCVAIVVKYTKDNQDFETYRYQPPLYYRDLTGRRLLTKKIGGTRQIDPYMEDVYKMGGVRGTFTITGEADESEEIPVAPEMVYAWHPGYYDTSNNYGTDTDWIDEPGQIIAYLAENYGDSPFTIGNTTTFGSVKFFDRLMQEWASYHTQYSGRFRLHWWNHEKKSTAAKIDMILGELPGMARRSIDDNGEQSLVCTTAEISPESPTANHSCATDGLLINRDIVHLNGLPQIEIRPSLASQIINDLEVHYDYDIATGRYRRIARCDPSGSDDGYGNAWPSSLHGAAAATLCAESQTMLTNSEPRKKIIKLKYHVYPETAVAVGLWYLWRYWRPWSVVRYVGGLSSHDVMPGQLIRFAEDVADVAKMTCVIPFRGRTDWQYASTVYWHVLSNKRIPNDGEHGILHEVFAMEHLNTHTAPAGSKMEGGAPTAGEGFDP